MIIFSLRISLELKESNNKVGYCCRPFFVPHIPFCTKMNIKNILKLLIFCKE